MDVVLVGLPGSGKSAIGRRLAQRHRAVFVDLDEQIERDAGRSIPEIFAAEGEAGFRVRERAAVEWLGEPDLDRSVKRVIATGGGTPVDPRNRWQLYRRRLPIWLDGRPEVLAQRLRHSPNVRPLVTGRDPIAAVRTLGAARERFYGAAHRLNGIGEIQRVLAAAERLIDEGSSGSTVLLRAETPIGRLVIGEGIAAGAVADALTRLEARRTVVISEPGAWAAAAERLTGELRDRGFEAEELLLPQGEAAKRLAVVEEAARDLARRRVERGTPIVAVGGGALGDTAGFIAATFLRGIPYIQVPTTLVAQIDSSIGGKTGVDLQEGKNLLGAFHQPAAIVIDVSYLASLPVRERLAALGEAVKMAALGDERLFSVLESDGAAIASGDVAAFESGAVAEVVERCAWAKVEVVAADEREEAGRIRLNLGHSLGHAFEAASEYRGLLHGEAVAYGLRAAGRIGEELGVTPRERRERIETLLTSLGLARGRLPYSLDAVLDALGADKKTAAGRLRWVLPTASGVVVRADVPSELVERVARGLLSDESGETEGVEAADGAEAPTA